MKLAIKKLRENAVIPSYGSLLAAGADLYACIDEDTVIPSGQTVMVPTGIAMAIPEGYVGLIFARSGLACKRGLAPANKVGVIDADYRGEIMVAVHNHDSINTWKDSSDDFNQAHTIRPGERIAQIAIIPYQMAEFEVVDELPETDRGAGGFGSTGQ